MINLPTLLPPSIDKAVENLTDKPTQVFGSGVAAILSLVFNPIIHFADKQREKYLRNLEIYKQEIQANLDAIPDEKRIEPKLQVVAQALEDSKYCIEEPDLRGMFANLIASASNATKADVVHPSFSVILKQMSSQDASVIRRIKQEIDKRGAGLPVAKLEQTVPDGSGKLTITKDIIIPEPSKLLQVIHPDSLSSLFAFGLITIDYSQHFAAEGAYLHFEQYADADGYKAKAERENGVIEIKKGICELTPYGQNFSRACGL